MFFIVSFIAAFVPMSVYLIILWVLDKYEKEPIKAVLFNYLWGAVGAVILSIAGVYFFQFLYVTITNETSLLDITSQVIFAPLIEEFMKALFLLLTFRNIRFDNITDGLVYGGAIGLGFGMTENFLYFISFGTTASSWVQLVIIRTVFSAVLHCITTATFGAFLGVAKFSTSGKKTLLIFTGYGLAVIMHGMWNLLVQNSSTSLIGFLMMSILITLFLIVFRYSTKRELKMIIEELTEEVNLGFIPANTVTLLNGGKVFKSINRLEASERIYLRGLVKLAFRRVQFKVCREKQKSFFNEEIEVCRDYLNNFKRD